MQKTVARPTTVFTFAQRADITITRHTADILVQVLMLKEGLRRKWKDVEFRQDVIEYGMLGGMAMAAGTLFSLVITFIH